MFPVAVLGYGRKNPRRFRGGGSDRHPDRKCFAAPIAYSTMPGIRPFVKCSLSGSSGAIGAAGGRIRPAFGTRGGLWPTWVFSLWGCYSAAAGGGQAEPWTALCLAAVWPPDFSTGFWQSSPYSQTAAGQNLAKFASEALVLASASSVTTFL